MPSNKNRLREQEENSEEKKRQSKEKRKKKETKQKHIKQVGVTLAFSKASLAFLRASLSPALPDSSCNFLTDS